MGTKKVAIIDDEPDIVTYLTFVLQEHGFEVCSATNATDGYEMIHTQRPDLVCLDILMPEETGFSLYRKIRHDQSLANTRVLIISGLNMENEMARLSARTAGEGAGALARPDGYIEKPIDLTLFISTVQKLAA